MQTASSEARRRPLIVGIGGTMRPSSSSERLLAAALGEAEALGARTRMFDGTALDLPLYAPHQPERSDRARQLVEALRGADGVIVVSPGYHGTLSGHLKNALDYIEDLRTDDRPYLDRRAVGCCAVAAGWQASVNTVTALRGIVHALRGWPTPFGVTVNSLEPLFTAEGQVADPQLKRSLGVLAAQVVDFANLQLQRNPVAQAA